MRGPSCQLVLNIENLNFDDITSLITSSVFLYQLAQAPPRNVLHFLVYLYSIIIKKCKSTSNQVLQHQSAMDDTSQQDLHQEEPRDTPRPNLANDLRVTENLLQAINDFQQPNPPPPPPPPPISPPLSQVKEGIG